MTHDEFTQTMIRSICAMIKALVLYYDIPLSRFIPKMNNSEYQRTASTTSTLDVTESKPL